MKKILVPFDFSNTSESALNYAVELSKYLSAQLILLHADQIPVMSPELSLNTISVQDMKQDSLDALKNLADKITLTQGITSGIRYLSKIGNTSEVVSEEVENLGVDFVVMGVTGHGSKFMQSMVGSASVDVSKKIQTPLIIVPPGATFKKIQTIAYACDFSDQVESTASLIKIKYLVTLFAANLHVLHLVPEGHNMSPKETGIGNFVERSLENTPHKTSVITESNIGLGILEFINAHTVDLLIIEPKKHSVFHKLFLGSTTNELVFNSPVPVLTIH